MTKRTGTSEEPRLIEDLTVFASEASICEKRQSTSEAPNQIEGRAHERWQKKTRKFEYVGCEMTAKNAYVGLI